MTAPGAEVEPATVTHVHVHVYRGESEAEVKLRPVPLFVFVAVVACGLIVAWIGLGSLIGAIISDRDSVAPFEVAGECVFAILEVGATNCSASGCCVEVRYNLAWRSRLRVTETRCLAPPDLLRNVTKCYRRGSRLSLARIPETRKRLREIRAAVWCTALIPPALALLACVPLVAWLASRPRGREPWTNCK